VAAKGRQIETEATLIAARQRRRRAADAFRLTTKLGIRLNKNRVADRTQGGG
jgi:hypothetical protein